MKLNNVTNVHNTFYPPPPPPPPIAIVFKPVLQAHLPCTFCMSPLSDTPEETVRPELGVSDKEDTKNVRGRGGCRTGLKTLL